MRRGRHIALGKLNVAEFFVAIANPVAGGVARIGANKALMSLRLSHTTAAPRRSAGQAERRRAL